MFFMSVDRLLGQLIYNHRGEVSRILRVLAEEAMVPAGNAIRRAYDLIALARYLDATVPTWDTVDRDKERAVSEAQVALAGTIDDLVGIASGMLQHIEALDRTVRTARISLRPQLKPLQARWDSIAADPDLGGRMRTLSEASVALGELIAARCREYRELAWFRGQGLGHSVAPDQIECFQALLEPLCTATFTGAYLGALGAYEAMDERLGAAIQKNFEHGKALDDLALDAVGRWRMSASEKWEVLREVEWRLSAPPENTASRRELAKVEGDLNSGSALVVDSAD